MKKTILVALMSFAVGFVSLGATVSAQVRGNYSRRDVSTTIKNLENSSDVFSRDFKRQMDQGRRNGTYNEDQFVRTVDNFENALDRLRRNFDRNKDWWESRNDVQGIMDEAQNVNSMMTQLRFARQLETQWRNMRRDVNALARTYQLPELGGGGWNGGNNNGGWNGGNQGGGNWGVVRPPSWAVGTFYGVSPQDGSQIALTIDNGGSITAQTGGSVTYGNYTRNNMIYINGYTSRISRTSGGLRTVSTNDGQTIDYSRNGYGGNTGYPGNQGYPGGAGGNVPNWAAGSYVGRNPQTGGAVYLTISNDGNVTVNVGGGNSYGTLNGTSMNVNGATSVISRTRNGLRTTSNTDGQTIDYRRQ